MDRYAVDSGSTSAGVFIRSSMAGIRARPRAVNAAHSTRVSTMAVWTVSRTFSGRWAP